MISRLKGKVIDISGYVATLDVSGVGYELYCSSRCLAGMILDEEVEVVVLTDMKQDSIRLYGFEDQLEKRVFLFLTAVKGVGARSASEIVSQIEKKELLRAIGSGDISRLQAIKGVGKKTAERIVVELKDKVADYVTEGSSVGLNLEKEVAEPFRDAVQALLALGFQRNEAEQAVRQVESMEGNGSMEAGQIVKHALRYV